MMEVDHSIVDDLKNLNHDDAEFTKKCSAMAHDISTGRLTILDLVEKLGDLLVSQSVVQRELGTWILTNILEQLPQSHLDEQQLNYICNFYTDKFRDTHQLIPSVLRGINSLIKYDAFPNGGARQILTSLFQHVPCQQQQQADRLLIYKFFKHSLEKQKNDLLGMGLNYVYGVISAVDGERDPKNLIFLLMWFPEFLKAVDFGHLTEEMFEVLACYFPVDFRAPPQDPDAITRETLADALCKCLCAIPQFAKYCIPLALEKLDSSLTIAKLDSLELLKAGCLTFDLASYLQHGTEIWSVIQKELFNSPSVELQRAYLTCLSSIINKISENEEGVKSILKNICDTLKGNLMPDSKLFEVSSTFLLRISGSSNVSAKFVTQEIVPILTNTYNITKTEKHQVQILAVSVEFAYAYAQFYYTIEMENLAAIPVNCVKASFATSDELRKAGFDGLKRLSKYLPVQIRLQTYKNLKLLLVTPDKVRPSILACFQKLAQDHGEEVKEKLIDALEGSSFPSLYLESLCKIAVQERFLDDVLYTLLIHFEQNAEAACANLKLLLEENEDDANIQNGLYERNLVNKLLALNVTEEEALRNVSAVLKALIGYQCSDKQQKIVDEALPMILDGERNIDVAFVHLLDGILSRLRRNVCINGDAFEKLAGLLARSEDVAVKEVAVQLLSNLLNKCEDESLLQECLRVIEAGPTGNNVMVMAWVCKALVMRNHRLANDWTNKLIQMLEIDPDVAQAFRIIMKDDFDTLSAKSYCAVTLLFKQRFFTVVSNALVEKYKPEFHSYLKALGYLMEFAPKQAVLLQFKKLLKLIILCLEQCTDPNVLGVLLQIFNDLISTGQSCVEDHLDEFLTRILKLCSEHESMKVRVLALQCMQNFAHSFPVYKLLPHKQTVISGLGRCVDDKKRIVRKEAVEARSLWFLLDAPM